MSEPESSSSYPSFNSKIPSIKKNSKNKQGSTEFKTKNNIGMLKITKANTYKRKMLDESDYKLSDVESLMKSSSK